MMGALTTSSVVYAQSNTVLSTNDTNISALLDVLQSLMKQVEELQKQLMEVRGEIRLELKAGLKEGMEDEDVKKIQELLASDPAIYPRGIISGYYGPLTTDAIKRFQEKHDLKVNGTVDEETRALLHEYFKERKDGRIPPGLLRATEVRERVKSRMQERYKNCSDVSQMNSEACNRVHNTIKKTPKVKESIGNTASEKELNQAQQLITQLRSAIKNVSTSEVDVEDAKENLEKAESALRKAKSVFSNKKYREAYDYARKAQKEAQEGLSELNSADDDEDQS